jgi:hypothetical protein
MSRLERFESMIINRRHYLLRDDLKAELSESLSGVLEKRDILKGYSVEQRNNEYYTSREFLDLVKESVKLKQGKYISSNSNSTVKSTIPLGENVGGENFGSEMLDKISSFISKNSDLPKQDCFNTGRMLYPKNGYMGWHNNSRVGWRIYCTYCVEDAKSYFRYEDDNGEFVDCLESKGWNFRFFYIRDTFSPFWHSIYTETERVAVGTYLGKDQNKIQNLIGELL